jgi:glycosyltransferase involved in cell wall biosynthesis
MKYLVVVPVICYPVSEDEFAMESAFCDHLKELLALVSSEFDEMVVAGFQMSRERYENSRNHLGTLHRERDKISFVSVSDSYSYPGWKWLLRAPGNFAKLFALVKDCGLVHSGTSHHWMRPVEFAGLVFGRLLGKKTISITDLDLREDPIMNYKLGYWSLKTYLFCRYLHDPIRDLQHRWVARYCDLVLMKGEKLMADYGEGRPWVKAISDPGFHEEHIIRPEKVEAKIAALEDPEQPLELAYFGRYVYYKGIDRCIKALAIALAEQPRRIKLNIMGSGEEEQRLRALAAELDIEDSVIFHEALRYGEEFFDTIQSWHLMLAAPLSVDTPRSTWDAIAAGLPVLAFDTEFYAGLGKTFGVVDTVEWPSVEQLAARIGHYADNRSEVSTLIRRCVTVAHQNTQEQWLAKRAKWTLDIMNDRPSSGLTEAV